jgi:hypothetical protein
MPKSNKDVILLVEGGILQLTDEQEVEEIISSLIRHSLRNGSSCVKK